MKIVILAPKVVENFISKFPEVNRNAYDYFNYDRRVVDESVCHHDVQVPYKSPDDLTNSDYNALVAHAKTLLNPILKKYSYRVACEDALHMAIRSYNNGLFDNKVNAGRYAVLLDAMKQPEAVLIPLTAKDKQAPKPEKKPENKPKKPSTITHNTLMNLGLTPTKIPSKTSITPAKKRQLQQSGVPILVRDKGVVIKLDKEK